MLQLARRRAGGRRPEPRGSFSNKNLKIDHVPTTNAICNTDNFTNILYSDVTSRS